MTSESQTTSLIPRKLPKWERSLDSLPGELFNENGNIYSVDSGVVYLNWKEPIRWTEDFRRILKESFELGFGVSIAAWSLGVSEVTIDWWLQRGQLISRLKGEGLVLDPLSADIGQFYQDIFEECVKARAEGITRRVNRIEAATDWRAQAWLLEKLIPEFAPKQNVALSVDFSQLSDDEIERLARTGRL